ncbi:HIRA-interacting protein 3 isoform X2 [Trichomycterus rosablanca]|uniref:HIRA-interacting protein 3 isoform X2 n=1 Tax=Trichomycterus rosablanca TaxID=2290929 RepID=UPI002F355146
MVSEEIAVRSFVSRELQRCCHLSTLTLGILRKRYLEHVGRESLSPDQRLLLKQIVEDELLKMQVEDSSSDDEPEVKSVNQNKRKRDDEEEEHNKDHVGATKKKSRLVSDSPDSGTQKEPNSKQLKEVEDVSDKNMGEESDEQNNKMEEKKKKKKQDVRVNKKKKLSLETEEDNDKKKTKSNGKTNAIISEEEDHNESSDSGEDKENQQKAKGLKKKQNISSDSEQEERTAKDVAKVKGKAANQKKSIRKVNVKSPNLQDCEAVRRVQKDVFGSSSESEKENEEKNTERKETSESDDDLDKEINERKAADGVSSDEEMEKKNEQRSKAEDSDSSSSLLPSLEDEDDNRGKNSKQEETKKKTKNSEKSESKTTARKDDENKAVSRLKRYIALCGVRRNYKKLLEGCRSVKSKVEVLKKELEELGVEGQPSIEKCKKARMKREEAQELAELDVSNIITTQGRPKRRRAAASWMQPESSSSPQSAYKRVVDSDSESEDGYAEKGRKRLTNWSNLRGIISDDADSN